MPEDNRIASRPLPTTVAEFISHRRVKTKATLNDMVEAIHIKLYEDERYSNFLDAVYDEQAVEGSLAADNLMAAEMIRNEARRAESPVAREKLATIAKSLGVVLRRYGESRKDRRYTVSGEIVQPDQQNGPSEG